MTIQRQSQHYGHSQNFSAYIHFFRVMVACLLISSLSACIHMPEQHTGVVDDRPVLSFKLDNPRSAASYRVYIDDVDQGTLDQYVGKHSGLRLISGTHSVRIDRNGQLVLEQQIYLGDGSSKQLLVR